MFASRELGAHWEQLITDPRVPEALVKAIDSEPDRSRRLHLVNTLMQIGSVDAHKQLRDWAMRVFRSDDCTYEDARQISCVLSECAVFGLSALRSEEASKALDDPDSDWDETMFDAVLAGAAYICRIHSTVHNELTSLAAARPTTTEEREAAIRLLYALSRRQPIGVRVWPMSEHAVSGRVGNRRYYLSQGDAICGMPSERWLQVGATDAPWETPQDCGPVQSNRTTVAYHINSREFELLRPALLASTGKQQPAKQPLKATADGAPQR